MLSESEKEWLRRDYKDTLMDRCRIGIPEYDTDQYPGEASPVRYNWEENEIVCGMHIDSPTEVGMHTEHIPGNTATLRLPYDAGYVPPDCRIRLTAKDGTPVGDPWEWAVEGELKLGVVGIVLRLRRVIGGSMI